MRARMPMRPSNWPSASARAGHEVWWDRHIQGGSRFSTEIDRELKSAEAVVVLWSKASVESAWVQDEAAEGRDSGRLVPVSLDGSRPPLGFRQFHTVELADWNWRWRARGDLDDLLGQSQDRRRAFGRRTSRRRRQAAQGVVDLRAAVRQHERRPGAGIFQRRHHRGHHHRSVEGLGAARWSRATPRSRSRAR